MNASELIKISGRENGKRLDSRLLEEKIQAAVEKGYRNFEIEAFGQHGIGGRLWKSGDQPVNITITGHSGQRVGSMGFPHTRIDIQGPGSDDIGWLNAGATIIVNGHAGNGLANAMAQGKVYVNGNIGARGMTMTKSNPRFDPPEIWVLGSVGDYFGEFMAGGTAVICGHEGQTQDNVLGYRPFVGMVGGRVFFRGPHKGYSQYDSKLIPINDEDWDWLQSNITDYLKAIKRPELSDLFSERNEWQLIAARKPQEKTPAPKRSMASFHKNVWDTELGEGGMIGDLTDLDRSPIPLIATGELRRFVPHWENRKYLPPCQATCPTGIPVHDRWRLVREGRVDEAVDLALAYTPFPATVCGYLCPNLCMTACTRQISAMMPVDITKLGKASLNAKIPEFKMVSGKKVAVIGGGPAGISVAWQLRQNGHDAVIFDSSKSLGGKMASVIPNSRVPKEVIEKEIERVSDAIPRVDLQQPLDQKDMLTIREDYDFTVIAAGAQKPRIIPIPGNERLITALDFLLKAKTDEIQPGEKIVIIGAGNVGCDVATEAYRLGTSDITLIDIQEPASFGKEREDAEAAGAKFKWPCFSKEITEEGVVLKSGELLPADTVVISIGDAPDLSFLPESIQTEGGFVKVNDHFQTSDHNVFAIGDIVRPGLLTDAIGAGRKAASHIDDLLCGKIPRTEEEVMIDRGRVTLEYFDPRISDFDDIEHCGSQCSSCGACRDCGLCITVCPQTAISRVDKEGDEYEYIVDSNKCIGCGFCAQACPCGVWNLVENDPIE